MDTEELKRLAKAATPGPWITKFERWVVPAAHADRSIGGSTNPADDFEIFAHQICKLDCKYLPIRSNAEYIAAANPAAVLALIAVTEAQTARIAELEAARFAYASEFPLGDDGEPDVGSIHANIRALKLAAAGAPDLHSAIMALPRFHHEPTNIGGRIVECVGGEYVRYGALRAALTSAAPVEAPALTDEEIAQLWKDEGGGGYPGAHRFARAIEARINELSEAYRALEVESEALKASAPATMTIPGDGLFGGNTVKIDDTLPPDTMEMRGDNRVRANIKTGEITVLPDAPAGDLPPPAGAAIDKAPDHSLLPKGWVPLSITHEQGYPEEVAYGPQQMMDRLKKRLDKYYAYVLADRAARAAAPAGHAEPVATAILSLPFTRDDQGNAMLKRADVERLLFAAPVAAEPAQADPHFDACEYLLHAAQKFWSACREAGQHGAVQWLKGSGGELLIYTRGEYCDQLMANIMDVTGQEAHQFNQAPAVPAPAGTDMRSAFDEFAHELNADPCMEPWQIWQAAWEAAARHAAIIDEQIAIIDSHRAKRLERRLKNEAVAVEQRSGLDRRQCSNG